MTVVRRIKHPPKPAPKKREWRVEGSTRGRESYGINLNIVVIAYTVEGAIAAVREKHPDANLVKIIGDRWVTDVIIAKEKAPSA